MKVIPRGDFLGHVMPEATFPNKHFLYAEEDLAPASSSSNAAGDGGAAKPEDVDMPDWGQNDDVVPLAPTAIGSSPPAHLHSSIALDAASGLAAAEAKRKGQRGC